MYVSQMNLKGMLFCVVLVYSRTSISRASINCASKKIIKKINFADTLLEFLEQERDSNFSDILTLRKLRTSIKLKMSEKNKQRFLTDFFKKDS
jgi:uncharacterized Rossmann fold enzyme